MNPYLAESNPYMGASNPYMESKNPYFGGKMQRGAGTLEKLKDFPKFAFGKTVEPALAVTSGLLNFGLSIPAGLGAAAGGATTEEAINTPSPLPTYQPITETGKKEVELINKPVEAFSKLISPLVKTGGQIAGTSPIGGLEHELTGKRSTTEFVGERATELELWGKAAGGVKGLGKIGDVVSAKTKGAIESQIRPVRNIVKDLKEYQTKPSIEGFIDPKKNPYIEEIPELPPELKSAHETVIAEHNARAVAEGNLAENPTKPGLKAQEGKVTEGTKPSGIAKSIEAKAIEQGLIEDGYDTLAEYTPTTMKGEATIMADIVNTDIQRLYRIITGEEPKPLGVTAPTIIKAAELYNKAAKDPELQYRLANSPLDTEISQAAQTLSLTRGRELDSFTAKVRAIKKARLEKAKMDINKTITIKKNLKSEVNKINLPKEELSWNRFLRDIIC